MWEIANSSTRSATAFAPTLGAIFAFQIMDKEILICVIVGIVLILLGLLIHKGKAYQLIAGYEILKWRGVDMNKLGKIFF